MRAVPDPDPVTLGRSPGVRAGLRELAAAGAATAGLLHLLVARDHLQEWWVFGVFFLALAAAQALLVWLLLRGPLSTPATLTAVCGTAVVVALYVITRTVGLPLGPAVSHHVGAVLHGVGNGVPVLPGSLAARHIEPVGAVDLGCLAAELMTIGALTGLLPPRVRSRTTNVMLALGLLALLPWLR